MWGVGLLPRMAACWSQLWFPSCVCLHSWAYVTSSVSLDVVSLSLMGLEEDVCLVLVTHREWLSCKHVSGVGVFRVWMSLGLVVPLMSYPGGGQGWKVYV